MLWGKGDSSKLKEDELVTLQHLRRMVETGHIYDLDYDKTQMLLRALDWYGDWEGTFRTMKHVRNVLVLMGFFLGAIWFSGGDPVQLILGLLK